MAEFSSSPEGQVLARLARLHRTEQAPAAARARFAEQMVRLQAAPPAARAARAGKGWPRRAVGARLALASLALASLASAALLWLVARSERVTPLREPAPPPHAAGQVSLSGVAVPGSLRWRASGHDSSERTCLYRFSLQPDVPTAPIEVHWTECTFPAQLREHTQRRWSSVSGELRVFVAGSWSEPGRLQATELRVLP